MQEVLKDIHLSSEDAAKLVDEVKKQKEEKSNRRPMKKSELVVKS